MSPLSKRVIVSFALMAFMIAFLTGVIFQVRAEQVVIRSVSAFFSFGLLTGLVATIFERLWNR